MVSRYLERAGYATRVAADGPGALRIAGETRPDLVVLDLMLPGMDGLEVMRRLREREPRVGDPANGEGRARPTASSGCSLGADDYVVKPFSPARAGGARGRGAAPGRPLAGADGADRVRRPRDRARGRAGSRSRGEEVQLTVREYDLLLHLVRHPGQVFSRDQLMDAVWQYSFYTDTSTVTVHMRRLRAKIEDDPSEPALAADRLGRGLPLPAVTGICAASPVLALAAAARRAGGRPRLQRPPTAC